MYEPFVQLGAIVDNGRRELCKQLNMAKVWTKCIATRHDEELQVEEAVTNKGLFQKKMASETCKNRTFIQVKAVRTDILHKLRSEVET
jgi:hypothetical protein